MNYSKDPPLVTLTELTYRFSCCMSGAVQLLCDAVAQSIYAVGRVVSVEDGTLAISASPKRTLLMLSKLTLYLPSKVIQQQRDFLSYS